MTPFNLTETTPGKFSLLLTTFDPASAIFGEAGHEGGGYGWESVARQVIEDAAIDEEKLDFDSEASMFCAVGTDRAVLEQLGHKLVALFNDPTALAALIEKMPDDAWDD